MPFAKVTSKGQMTIPKAIRERLGIRQGDLLRVAVQENRVVMTRIAPADEAELEALEATLEEWLSEADEDAYRDL